MQSLRILCQSGASLFRASTRIVPPVNYSRRFPCRNVLAARPIMGNSQSAAEEPTPTPQEAEPMQTTAPVTAKRTAAEAEEPSSQAEGDEADPLHYLKREHLTNVSEQFKVEIKGLPRHIKVPDLKRLAKKLNLVRVHRARRKQPHLTPASIGLQEGSQEPQ